MSNSDATPEKANLSERFAFGGAQFASCLFPAFTTYYLMGFYTDVALISPWVTGVLLMFLRLIGACNEYVVGLFMNRTRFRDGKYRPYFKWCAVPYAVSLALLCLTPVTSMTGKIAFAAAMLFTCELFSSALSTAAHAMVPYIARGDVDRTRFVSFSNASCILTFIVVGTFLLPIADFFATFFGNGNRQVGLPLTLTLFAVIAVPLHLNAYFRLQERHFVVSTRKPAVRELLSAITHNRRLLLFMLGFGVYTIANAFKSQIGWYYVTYNMGRPELLPVVILAGLISPLAMQPVMPRLAARVAKETLIVIGLFGAAASAFLMLAAGNSPAALLGCLVLYGLFTAITANQVYTVMASFADEISSRNEIQMSEILAATTGFTYRAGAAIAIGIASLVLALTGYMTPTPDDAGNLATITQSPTALWGIKALFIFSTAGGMVLAGVIMLKFRSVRSR